MKTIIKPLAFLLAPALFLTLTPSVCAATLDDNLADAQIISQMEQHAQQANPRDQCYLYAELVHTMTEMAVKQIANGDDDKATMTLKQIDRYAHLIQANLAKNTKRLKNAEELMDHTTYHLAQALHLASDEDRTNVQATLKQLDIVQNQLLDQVFNH